MNYYERHLGDYSKNASHLTLLEHGVYARLIDVYYTREAAIPEDKAARLIGARTAPETEALQLVLQEFFILRDGHWHQDRCDEEIEKYLSGEPEREVKKANQEARLHRHREERANLFRTLTAAGLHADWNIRIGELRALVKSIKPPSSETHGAVSPATTPATPATATHYPLPTTQLPDIKEEADTRTGGPSTDAGRVCLALKKLGLTGLNPGHPDLLALIAAGATEDEFLGAGRTAFDRGKGFAYAIGTLKRQRLDAKASAEAMHRGALPPSETEFQRSQRERMTHAVPSVAAKAPGARKPHPMEIIDGIIDSATSRPA